MKTIFDFKISYIQCTSVFSNVFRLRVIKTRTEREAWNQGRPAIVSRSHTLRETRPAIHVLYVCTRACTRSILLTGILHVQGTTSVSELGHAKNVGLFFGQAR